MKKCLLLFWIVACQLRWMPSPEEPLREYRVYYAKNSTSEWRLIGITDPEQPILRVLRKGFYCVTAVDLWGKESDGSNVVYKKKLRNCDYR